MKRLETELRSQCHPKFNILGPMMAHTRLQFPETRLVQYDCGKCQCSVAHSVTQHLTKKCQCETP